MTFCRTLVESAQAEAELDRLRKAFSRFDEFWLGWSWRLARGPDRGAVQIPGSDPPAYVIRTFEFSVDVPEISLLYRFTADEVEIIAIRQVIS